MEYILLVVVFIPLMVSIFLNSISTLLNERLTTFITINGALLSFTVSLFMFGVLLLDKFKPISLKLYTWFPEPEIRFEFLLDGLSGTMMLLVTGLGLVIQIFSTSYMSGDPRYVKYFVYFNFFVFSMLLLVMSANFLVMFFGWELVGLSSYLLISFWSEKKEAAKAGNKAFVLNRNGDFGFLIALMMILKRYLLTQQSHSLDLCL